MKPRLGSLNPFHTILLAALSMVVVGCSSDTQMPAEASRIAVNGGNDQILPVGSMVPVSPSVIVTDESGNPVPGVAVAFAVTSGGGVIVTGASQTTGSDGIASVGSWMLGAQAGVNTLTATSAGLTNSPVTFTATGVLVAAGSIVAIAGNNQTAVAGAILPIDPSVLVTDGGGDPAPGVPVTFAVASGGGGIAGASSTTNAAGIATVGEWTLGAVPGTNTLTATAAGFTGSPVIFTASGVAAGANTIAVNGGINQTAVVGSVLPVNPSVIVTAAGGSPVVGAAVEFAVGTGGGSVSGASQITNASGIATVGGWTLGTTTGTNTLIASSPGAVGSPVTFTAIATPGAAAAAQTTASVPGGVTGSATIIAIQARDQFGNNLSAGGANITVVITGANAGAAVVVTDNFNGTYTATYTPAGPGTDNVAIQLGGAPISGSPFFSVVTGSGSTATTTTITSHTPDPSVVGEGFTVSFTVSGGPTPPTGNVTVIDSTYGIFSCSGALTAGSGSCVLTLPIALTHRLTATYPGDATHGPSTSVGVDHLVNAAPTTITITADTPDPSTIGASPIIYFLVTSPNTIPNHGIVTLTDGVDYALGCPVMDGGLGGCYLDMRTPGDRTIYAVYEGATNWLPSISTGVTHHVNLAVTTTTIIAHTPDPSTVNQGITVTVRVTSVAGTPPGTGFVTDGTATCFFTLVAGDGSCVLTPTTSGAKTLTATYVTTSIFGGSVSPGVAHQVNP